MKSAQILGEINLVEYKKYKYKIFILDYSKPTSEWCETNLRGKYSWIMNYWYFEFEEDAILFKLTWGYE